MQEQTWQAFINWCAKQERTTFYKATDDNHWYVEWFNQKGGFNYDSDPDLETVMGRVIKK